MNDIRMIEYIAVQSIPKPFFSILCNSPVIKMINNFPAFGHCLDGRVFQLARSVVDMAITSTDPEKAITEAVGDRIKAHLPDLPDPE